MATLRARRTGFDVRRRGPKLAVALALALLSPAVVGLPVAGAAAAAQTLTVSLGGNGNGTVTSSPAGIDCGSTCTFDFNDGDLVSLAADPAPSSDFDHWSGDCSGSGACDLTMDGPHAVTAVFTLKTRTLSVNTGGAGSGTVTSSPAGINCPSNCTQGYDHGTVVDLTPSPDAGSTFDHWTGDCTGGGACSVTMNSDQTVGAVFTLTTHTLDVATAGNGSGSVTSSPAGINCPSNCTQDYDHGTVVDLTPSPDPGSDFDHWTGACTGGAACSVTMNGNRSVSAVFTLTTHTLNVATAGSGSGTVTSSPAGINCPSNCTQDYDHGTVVDLTPAPAPSSVFDHWTGDCTGGAACSVTMNGNRNVSAVFTLKLRTLDVTRNGTGSGTVTSGPAGIDCAPACSHTYNHGTDVTLTPTPAVGSLFDHWSGDCSGSGSCDLHLNQDRTVAATFTLRRLVLTVTKGGNGVGLVTSTPAGINCRIPCTALTSDYDYGTSVTLRAAPGLGSGFIGWRGACTGRRACVVSMTHQHQVQAVFSTVCGRIAFVSARSGNDDILTINPDGSRAINVTQNPAADSDAAWSPDCSQIAFVSDRSGNPDIWVMNTDGTGVHRVTSSPADDTQPSWAPRGNRIVFTHTVGTNGDLYIVGSNATHLHRLTSGPADDFRPDWSPNGLRIAFVSNRNGAEQVFTMSSRGGGVVQITHGGGQSLQPAWSPGGKRIAFVSTRDGNRDLYIANADGSGVLRLTRNPGVDAHPSWSPRGAKITFFSTRAGDDEIFTIDVNATHLFNVSRNPASDTGPVWTS
jgi:Tol biopolymer transport system component/opacity protein-like surface antigen